MKRCLLSGHANYKGMPECDFFGLRPILMDEGNFLSCSYVCYCTYCTRHVMIHVTLIGRCHCHWGPVTVGYQHDKLLMTVTSIRMFVLLESWMFQRDLPLIFYIMLLYWCHCLVPDFISSIHVLERSKQ